MRSPRLVAALVALVLLAPATLVVSRAAPAAAAPLPCATRDPFAGGVAQSLAARYPGRHFTAQVYDQATGCVYDLTPAASRPRPVWPSSRSWPPSCCGRSSRDGA